MKRIFTLLLLVLTQVSMADCQVLLNKVNTCVDYKWTSGPYLNSRGQRNFSELEVKFFMKDDASESPIKIDGIKVYPWMIMAGMQHGTRPVQTTALTNGSYLVSEIFLRKMMGHWEIRFGEDSDDFDPQNDDHILGKFIIK
ncbi:hypothetical protein A9Q84_03670 [Halobacteriovorax marinus]|uniref:YtkA-like domain-containing protein n=1 Tax=Halobacteriovorax marinus TaxID=97084 RepID=A0A1Y5FA85_9BACT|nr:hypothetical protein A9Q84_03670 [Halobacteriovorax marinus]